MEPKEKNPSNREQNPMSREREPREPGWKKEENPKKEGGENRPYPGWEEEGRETRREGGEEGQDVASEEELGEDIEPDQDMPRR